MRGYLLGRLFQAVLLTVLVSAAIYGLIGLMPGDPIDVMLAGNPEMTPEDAARLRAIYGLDRPLHERYLAWAGAALQGDLGYSRLYNRPVLDVLLPRLGNSAILVASALALAVALALPLGIAAARHAGRWPDRLVNLFCFAGISTPSFWLALLLILLFSVTLGWLPAGGTHPIGRDGLADRLPYLAMPVAALALLYLAQYTRHLRAAMIEVLRQDYIRTARAKGASASRVTWRHALRNAAAPLITLLALDLGTLFGGALVIETIFAYQGTGKMIYDAILGNDYNLALAGLLLITVTIVLANLLADLVQAGLDPRVTLGREGAPHGS